MSHDLIYELLVGAGIFLLLFAGLVLLAGCVDPARGEAAIQDAGRDRTPLAIAIGLAFRLRKRLFRTGLLNLRR